MTTDQLLWFLGALGIMLCVPLLAGLAATGSWKLARRYWRDWARGIVIMLVAGAVLFLIVVSLIPSP
jgi:hypothetical protein